MKSTCHQVGGWSIQGLVPSCRLMVVPYGEFMSTQQGWYPRQPLVRGRTGFQACAYPLSLPLRQLYSGPIRQARALLGKEADNHGACHNVHLIIGSLPCSGFPLVNIHVGHKSVYAYSEESIHIPLPQKSLPPIFQSCPSDHQAKLYHQQLLISHWTPILPASSNSKMAIKYTS